MLLFFVAFSIGDIITPNMNYDEYIKNGWLYKINTNNITNFEEALKHSYINIIVMLFFAILMITVFIIAQRKNKINNSMPKIIRKPFFVAKIDLSLKPSKFVEADILQRIAFSFRMIHKLAAKNNNTVIIDYDPKYLRYYRADFDNISYLFYSLTDFFLNFVSNSNIFIDLKQGKAIDETINLKAIFRISANLSEVDDKIKNALLGQTKEILYKKLALSARIAKVLNTKLTYSNKANEAQFIYDLKLSSILDKRSISILNRPKKQMSALIAETNVNIFYIIANWLRYYDIAIKPRYEWEIVKRHLTNKIFKPNFVFIQAEIIKKLPHIDLELLKEEKEKKNIIVVIISNNERYDNVVENLDFETILLKQPFIQDDLLNILNQYKENTTQMEFIKLRGGVFGEEGSLVAPLSNYR